VGSPGSTAPDESRTTPAIVACAKAALGIDSSAVKTNRVRADKATSSSPLMDAQNTQNSKLYEWRDVTLALQGCQVERTRIRARLS
jgi:hypothetical protein